MRVVISTRRPGALYERGRGYVRPALQASAAASSTPYSQPDLQRVGEVQMDPFVHFCAVCGAHGAFGFGCDFAGGTPGLWACLAHRGEVERRWKRS